MDELILVYTTWESEEHAKKAGKYLSGNDSDILVAT
ncbi:MAG: hypothetical protein UU12_C0043G0006 [Candidatus Woesebacteria bacterium GW2011_GWA2_40_7b]|uniref:Uncharacterized protein n=1 Tax=Candidatus Woesebacteria bacterium GW2011_GWA2_40_7b TaxID=1618563 RepID=A0A0G0VBT2_9BACT|nr:MAG: hypothetical protein UU12_C0043G0006 [Candidatus Woesebacteria bacterium GW2011_GWA2_40_7b]